MPGNRLLSPGRSQDCASSAHLRQLTPSRRRWFAARSTQWLTQIVPEPLVDGLLFLHLPSSENLFPPPVVDIRRGLLRAGGRGTWTPSALVPPPARSYRPPTTRANGRPRASCSVTSRVSTLIQSPTEAACLHVQLSHERQERDPCANLCTFFLLGCGGVLRMVPDSRVRRRRRRREWRFGFLAVDRPATEEVPVAPLPNSWGCPGSSPVSISLTFLCLAIGYYPRVGLRTVRLQHI